MWLQVELEEGGGTKQSWVWSVDCDPLEVTRHKSNKYKPSGGIQIVLQYSAKKLSIDSFLALLRDTDTVRWSCSSNVITPP